MHSKTLKYLAALLIAFGVWQMGHGLYIKVKAEIAQILLAHAWQETVIQGHAVKPWSWADTWPVAKLEAPRLGKSAIILRSASGQAMAFGPGHMNNTPQPGERGISVIAAHRDTHFKFLQDLKKGDEIRITTPDNRTHNFRITYTSILHTDHSGLDPYAQGIQIALVTCYPFNAITQGPLRYVVFGEKIGAPQTPQI